MPPRKKVQSLREIANKVIAASIANYCVNIESGTDDVELVTGEKAVKSLSSVLLDLPGVLLDDLTYTVITRLLRSPPSQDDDDDDEDKWPGLQTALRLLPQVNIFFK